MPIGGSLASSASNSWSVPVPRRWSCQRSRSFRVDQPADIAAHIEGVQRAGAVLQQGLEEDDRAPAVSPCPSRRRPLARGRAGACTGRGRLAGGAPERGHRPVRSRRARARALSITSYSRSNWSSASTGTLGSRAPSVSARVGRVRRASRCPARWRCRSPSPRCGARTRPMSARPTRSGASGATRTARRRLSEGHAPHRTGVRGRAEGGAGTPAAGCLRGRRAGGRAWRTARGARHPGVVGDHALDRVRPDAGERREDLACGHGPALIDEVAPDRLEHRGVARLVEAVVPLGDGRRERGPGVHGGDQVPYPLHRPYDEHERVRELAALRAGGAEAAPPAGGPRSRRRGARPCRRSTSRSCSARRLPPPRRPQRRSRRSPARRTAARRQPTISARLPLAVLVGAVTRHGSVACRASGLRLTGMTAQATLGPS